MGLIADLHLHSTASDGTCTPSELVAMGKDLGLSALALTDHDTLLGVPEFLEAANNHLLAIPGVELSARFPSNANEIHIVGLFVDQNDSVLNDFLAQTITKRNSRNFEMVRRLNGLGMSITIEELDACSDGGSIGRPLVARLLVEKGYYDSIPDVFEYCLRRGMPGYVPRELPPPKSCIDMIHHAGGVAIWAHPVYRRKNERVYVRTTLDLLTPIHLDGIETCCSVFSEAQSAMISEFAERYKLLPSGGSDFHGNNQPSISMGKGMGNLVVPYELIEPLYQRHLYYAPHSNFKI